MPHDRLDERIVGYVRDEAPVTTQMVADAIGVAWNTAQIHLYKLMAQRRVELKKVGRQNVWMISLKSLRRK